MGTKTSKQNASEKNTARKPPSGPPFERHSFHNVIQYYLFSPHRPITCPQQIQFSHTASGILENLPKEVLYEIASYLSDFDLQSLKTTCRSNHFHLSQNSFWTNLLKKRDVICMFRI